MPDLSMRLDELEALIAGLPDDDKAALVDLAADELAKPWLPQPGPQTEAYHSRADLLLYGGAAGGGKTDLICGLALCEHEKTVVFRRQSSDLDGFWDRLSEVAQPVLQSNDTVKKKLRTTDGRTIEGGHLEKPRSELSWQGRPHDLIGFDEGAQLSAYKVNFVMGWLRSANDGQRCRAVIASNPPVAGEGDWMLEWFAPWLDPMFSDPAEYGELRWAVTVGDEAEIRTVWVNGPEPVEIEGVTYYPLSRTFIPSKLDDNAYLKDTNYRAQINAMPEPLRSQLMEGDFLAGREDHAFQVIPTDWVNRANERSKVGMPPKQRMMTLGVDVAQGGADNTVLAPLYTDNWFAEPEVHKGVDTKDGPAVAGLVIKALKDNAHPAIDLTGGWGGSARDHLAGVNIHATGIVFSAKSGARTKDQKLEFYNKRSEMWWKFREALDPKSGEQIKLPLSPKLKRELTAPRWILKGSKILIESKDEIRERLGSSTDEADAVIMAWAVRHMTVAFEQKAHDGKPMTQQVEDADPFAMI